MHPILVQIGPLAIRYYGLMYVIAIVAGTVATSFDGYPMARQGKAGKALTIAAIASGERVMDLPRCKTASVAPARHRRRGPRSWPPPASGRRRR